MSTIDNLKTSLASCDGVLTCRWFDTLDETAYNNYIAGGSVGEVYLRLFVVWLNDNNTFSKEICNIGVLNGDAYWERVPQLFRSVPEPTVFETKLAAKISDLIGEGSVIVRIKMEELDIENTFVIARVFSIDGTTIQMMRYFAYLNSTNEITAKPYVEA